MQRIYFDNNATTPLDPAVHEAMLPYLWELFGNPSSGHRFGEVANLGVEKARDKVASLINCQPNRIFFTSGGTESNNTAIWSAVSAYPEKKHIITSAVEHASVLTPLEFLKKNFGYTVEILPVDDQGGLDLDAMADVIQDDTVLVTLMAANNESGVVWPLAEIGKLCRDRKVLCHCDAVQLVGKEPVNVTEIPVDYLAIAAHKMHGPKGSGALYVRRTAPMTSLIMGASQERGHRAGTENVAGIVGFGKACELAEQGMANYNTDIKKLRDTLQNRITSEIDDVIVNGSGQPRLANTLNVSFKNCASGAMVQELDEKGLAVSAHSACHSGDLDPSHVLKAMSVPETHIHGTLRISLSRFNTGQEVDELLNLLPGVVAKSRQGLAI
jgi:cysteine desulfurase